jgi:hypothetical protein
MYQTKYEYFKFSSYCNANGTNGYLLWIPSTLVSSCKISEATSKTAWYNSSHDAAFKSCLQFLASMDKM